MVDVVRECVGCGLCVGGYEGAGCRVCGVRVWQVVQYKIIRESDGMRMNIRRLCMRVLSHLPTLSATP